MQAPPPSQAPPRNPSASCKPPSLPQPRAITLQDSLNRHFERNKPTFLFPIRSCESVGLCREKSLFDLSVATHRSWKLLQKPHIVLKEHLNIINPVLQHRQPVDPDAERKSAHAFRIVSDKSVHRRIDHPRPKKFNPSRAFAFPARPARRCPAAAAEHARHIELHRRFRKRKIARPEPRLYARPEKLLHEIFDRAGEIAECNVRVHRQSLDLVKR